MTKPSKGERRIDRARRWRSRAAAARVALRPENRAAVDFGRQHSRSSESGGDTRRYGPRRWRQRSDAEKL